ncbi:MAG: Gfo/Idh/MocA family oxidoreductase [Actinobacteria bacterium]|nr:Gfo/Idh/MocA family oxidoreductase [Actinomycetota bacterium]
MAPLRIGILGAARIAPPAVIKPAAAHPDVAVTAIAARDPERARAFATKHAIPTVHPTYDALLADPEIDAVYNPLPNGLHARWTIAALEAGKHVLCEKPFTSNAAEAREVAAVADARPDQVLMEAFHYRYHPFAERIRSIASGGELGTIRRVDTSMCIPLPLFNDIRYDLSLAGGATMDVGCYAIHVLRLLAGEEPEVVSATAKLQKPGIDRAMSAEVRFPGGASGGFRCSMWSSTLLSMGATVVGDTGTLKVRNFTMPHLGGKLTVITPNGKRSERGGDGRTYTHQMAAFADAVLRGGPVLTPPSDSIATMEVIDAAYAAAGLPLRGT